MKIEQLYFTRTDGDSSGWKYVNISDGVTDEVKQSFQSIHTSTPSSRDMYAFDFSHNQYYLSKVTADGLDSLGRAKCFVHGYVFSGNDTEYIFSNFCKLLNINYFAKNDDNGIVAIDDLPPSPFNPQSFEQKLNLNNLMNAVYEAMLSNKALYIYAGTDSSFNEIILKSMIAVIYSYLPFNLKKFATFSSINGGLTRKITIVNSLNDTLGIVYDYTTGQVSGCSGTYEKFINAMLVDPKYYLDGVDKYIVNAHATSNVDAPKYTEAFNYVMMSNTSDDSDSASETVDKLSNLIVSGNINDPSTASYIAMLVLRVVKNRLSVTPTISNYIIDSYNKTNFADLKDSIAKYIAYLYKDNCSDNDFMKFQGFKLIDEALYKNVSIDIIKGNGSEFIRQFSKVALVNANDSTFITDALGSDCSAVIAKDLAKYIVESENSAELVKNVINKTLHKEVIDNIVSLNPDKALVWNYLEGVFTFSEYLESFKKLETETVQYLFAFIVNESADNVDRTVTLLRRIYSVYRNGYDYLQKKLSEGGKYAVLDNFYANVLLNDASSTQGVIDLQNEFNRICSQSVLFNKAVVPKYVSAAKAECTTVGETLSCIKRTKAFIDAVGGDSSAYTEQLINHFWDKFRLDEWDPDIDYSPLFVSGNKICGMVGVLQHAAAVLRNEENEDEKIIAKVVKLLATDETGLNKRARDKIIRTLKEVVQSYQVQKSYGFDDYTEGRSGKNKSGRSSYSSSGKNKFDINMDLYLLVHYSNEKEVLNPSMKIFDTRGLLDYILKCKRNISGHMLCNDKVIVGLYQICYKNSEKSSRGRETYRKCLKELDEIIKDFDSSTKKAILKQIKKATGGSDVSWICCICLAVVCAFLFNLISVFDLQNWLSIVLKVVSAVAGVAVIVADAFIDARKHQKPLNMILQIVSGLSLFATLIFAISIFF